MAALLPLRLMGTGTADVEALPSYLVRLASSHAITTGHLLRVLLGGPPDSSDSLAAGIQSQPFAGLVRPNSTTLGVLRSTSLHTVEASDTLIQGTFALLTPALRRSYNTYARAVRWCPACLAEQAVDHSSAYLKLVWFLQDVRACSSHRIRLRDRCPTCLRFPRPLNRWTCLRTCQFCAGRLDQVTQADSSAVDPQEAAPDLVKFVGDLVHRRSPFAVGAVNQYVDAVFNEAWASEREQELWQKLPRDDCLRYAAPSEPVTLPTARRIAYLLEVPICELLEGHAPSIQSFGFATEHPLPAPMQPAKRGRIADTTAIERYLITALEEGRPHSLREAAREIGTTVGAMRYHFPGLVSRLSLLWSSHIAAELVRKKARAREAVFSSIETWRTSQARPLTRKALLVELSGRTGLPKNVLREAIHQWWLPALAAADL